MVILKSPPCCCFLCYKPATTLGQVDYNQGNKFCETDPTWVKTYSSSSSSDSKEASETVNNTAGLSLEFLLTELSDDDLSSSSW